MIFGSRNSVNDICTWEIVHQFEVLHGLRGFGQGFQEDR